MTDPKARRLLALLHRTGTHGYWWVAENRQSFWWEVGRPTPLPGGRRNVYFGVHPTDAIPPTNASGETKPPGEVRSQVAYIAVVNCLFSEYDLKDFPNEEALEERIKRLDPPPSIIVHSGGGRHCYWLLASPWRLSDDETRDKARKVQAAWVRYTDGDGQAKDLARVLRVPGTYNHKYQPPRPVTFVKSDFGTVYAIDELAALCAHLIDPETTRNTAGSGGDRHAYADAALAKEALNVRRAADGHKHGELRDSAIKIGTLIARGWLDEQEAKDVLFHAVEDRAKDKAGARKTIEDGVNYGKARPRDDPKSSHSANNANNATREDTEWSNPIPFHSLDLPAFPTDVFPEWLRAFVDAEAEATQTPPDLAGMLALSVLSTACARYVAVQAKPGWIEPVNVFTITALPPASGKSSVFAAMVSPLVDEERRDAAGSKAEIAELTAHKEILEQQLNEAKREAARANGQQNILTAMEKVDRLAREVAATEIPAPPRLIVDDISSEQLSTMLCEHDGRIAALSPEGDIFGIMAGRYSANSTPNFSVYLKAHAGDTLRVDRKGRAAEFVERPALTMGLTVQPDVLRGLAGKEVFRGLGLLGRFLYSLPKSLIGTRKVDSAPVPDKVRGAYQHHVTMLFRGARILAGMNSANSENNANIDNNSLGSHFSNIYLLSFSEPATVLFAQFREWLEPKLADGAEFSSFTDWAGKLHGTVVRLAGLLHMASVHGQPQRDIQPDTLTRAIALAQYLVPHARAAFAEIGADPSVAAARHVLSWIDRKQIATFTKRDAFEGVKGRFRRAADLDPVLDLLSDHTYIRAREMDERSGPGRKPSQVYDVNPLYTSAHNSHNSQNTSIDPLFTGFTTPQYSHNSQNGHVTTYSKDCVEAGGRRVWRLWDDKADKVIGEYATEDELEAAIPREEHP